MSHNISATFIFTTFLYNVGLNKRKTWKLNLNQDSWFKRHCSWAIRDLGRTKNGNEPQNSISRVFNTWTSIQLEHQYNLKSMLLTILTMFKQRRITKEKYEQEYKINDEIEERVIWHSATTLKHSLQILNMAEWQRQQFRTAKLFLFAYSIQMIEEDLTKKIKNSWKHFF